MKIKSAMMMVVVSAMASGCWLDNTKSSPQGGVARNNGQFSIAVPTFDTDVKQGKMKMITISINRDEFFKQDVKLQVKVSKGISVDPKSIKVNAEDRPDVQLQVTVPQDAALGEYIVVVRATPETGESTSVGFAVNVVSP